MITVAFGRIDRDGPAIICRANPRRTAVRIELVLDGAGERQAGRPRAYQRRDIDAFIAAEVGLTKWGQDRRSVDAPNYRVGYVA